jgi:hypothetical protein
MPGVGERDAPVHLAGHERYVSSAMHGARDRSSPRQPVALRPVDAGRATLPASRLGAQRSHATRVGGTRSSQTVCQIPVVRGYQMRVRLELPVLLAARLREVGGSSSARTTISAACVGAAAS